MRRLVESRETEISMDQELKDYLDRQSEYLERQFAELSGEIHQTRALVEKLDGKLSGEIEKLDGKLSGEIEKLDGKLSGEIHQTRVLVEKLDGKLSGEIYQMRILVEKLDDKIDLVAEGVQSNTEVMHRLVDENRHELQEHKVVMESAHRHLEHRVSGHDTEIVALRRRVRQLEV